MAPAVPHAVSSELRTEPSYETAKSVTVAIFRSDLGHCWLSRSPARRWDRRRQWRSIQSPLVTVSRAGPGSMATLISWGNAA